MPALRYRVNCSFFYIEATRTWESLRSSIPPANGKDKAERENSSRREGPQEKEGKGSGIRAFTTSTKQRWPMTDVPFFPSTFPSLANPDTETRARRATRPVARVSHHIPWNEEALFRILTRR